VKASIDNCRAERNAADAFVAFNNSRGRLTAALLQAMQQWVLCG